MIELILIPMVAALALLLLRGQGRGAIALATVLLVVGSLVRLILEVWRHGPQIHTIGGWKPPLGIELYCDGLSLMFLGMTGVVGAFTSVYAHGFFAPAPDAKPGWQARDAFWPVWLFLWGSLNALYLSGDIFNLYVVLELVSLAAVSLAALSGAVEGLRAALRYLLAALTGSMAYLMGVALAYGAFHQLDLRLLGQTIEPGPVAAVSLTLMTVGLLLKTALFPLHFWLPPAHSSATAPVSAVLSALVVKGSFYILVRLWFEAFQQTVNVSSGQLIGLLGAVAVLWGSFQAVRQTRLKLLIAHSTVGQIGYLFLLFPLVTAAQAPGAIPWHTEAWTGGVYQAVAHGLAKAAMFLAAGSIIYALGTDRLDALRNMAGRLPLSTFALALAGVSLIGLPPSGGFVAKWMLMKAIIASGQWWWLIVVMGGGLLTAGYVFLMIRSTFARAETEPVLRPVPRLMELSALALALAAVLIGFRLEEPLRLLQIGPLLPRALEGGSPW
jgi:multicomponent Na+:H+ antiporter subunit D